MADSLLYDVQKLMDMGFGDDRILRQIYRACKNNEAISNYERNYVRTLVDEHLIKSIPIPEPEEETLAYPDVVIPNPALPQLVVKPKPQHGLKGIMSWPMRKKLILGIAVFLLIGIIITAVVAVLLVSIVDPPPPPPPQPPTVDPPVDPPPPEIPSFSVGTDLMSYDRLDLILISGTSADSDPVTLSIGDPNGQTIWAETVLVRGNQYSTLTIAGGQGWTDSGVYDIEAFNGVDRVSEEFTFYP